MAVRFLGENIVAHRDFRVMLASMDWQQVCSLAIVGLAAGLLLYGKLRRRPLGFSQHTHCGCASPAATTPRSSIVFRARKGERPQVVMKMR
jgi:hypothetical protein